MDINTLLNGVEQNSEATSSNPMDLSALLNPVEDPSLPTPEGSGNEMNIDDTYETKIPRPQHSQIKTEEQQPLQYSFGLFRSVRSSSPSLTDENDTAATSPVSDWTSSFPLPQMKLEPLRNEEFKPSPTQDSVILPSMYIPRSQVEDASTFQCERKPHQYRMETFPTSKPFNRSVVTINLRKDHHSLLKRVKRAHCEEDTRMHRLQTSTLPYHYSHSSVHCRAERKHKPPHSNKPYTPEHVYWMRYMKEDCGKSWKEMLVSWHIQFSDDPRESDQCLSSRYYRNNKAPEVDQSGNPIVGPNGKAVMFSAKVRSRTTPQGKAMDVPFKFVEKHPEAALTYAWVSEGDKAIARKIISGETVESRMSEFFVVYVRRMHMLILTRENMASRLCHD
jgi:hypothetical protein